jgi:uncharacterized repeat protein (TIGR03803 family)
MAVLGALIIFVHLSQAQPLQPEVLFSFPGLSLPNDGLVQGSDGSFYGTTRFGGDYGAGTVFKATTNGILTTLASFGGTNGENPTTLAFGSDGNLYGTSRQVSGTSATVFKVTTNGILTTLAQFSDLSGIYSSSDFPPIELTPSGDGSFYGVAIPDALSGWSVFRVTTTGVLTFLVSFDSTNGTSPSALTLGRDGNLYGTTYSGGIGNYGTVFKVTTNGALTTLVSFANTNGAYPSGLTLGSDGNFYGMTWAGGAYTNRFGNGLGTVFQVTSSGALTTLVSFNGTNGAGPETRLTLGSDGNLYGTTSGISFDFSFKGIFLVTTNGVLTTLTSFHPDGGLTLGNDGNLYGTTSDGGSYGDGSLVQVTTNGLVSTLASFESPGAAPNSLIQGPEGDLFGTTRGPGYGTIFRLTTNKVFTTLLSFDFTNGIGPSALALGGDGSFYGTTEFGGNFDGGTVFKVATNGALTTLASFAGTNGGGPRAGLTLGSDGAFYGTTDDGMGDVEGTVFRVANGILTTLVYFNGANGAFPEGLTFGSDGNLYGATDRGGLYTNSIGTYFGTVFRMATNGALTTLLSFNGTNGGFPAAGLTPGKDGNLYGTTGGGGDTYGGSFGDGLGTVFRLTTNGVLTTLVSFNGTNGAYPAESLTVGSDGNLYGTTVDGGNNWGVGNTWGTVYQVTTNGILTTLVSFNYLPSGSPTLMLSSDGDFYGTIDGGGPRGDGIIYRLRHGAYLQSFEMTTNGFQLNTLNVGGSGWVVLESSSDLMTWMPIQTNGMAAAQTFLDPTALTQPRQFYRVRQL